MKQLLGRINLQIRRLVDGSPSISERLLRDALFFSSPGSARRHRCRCKSAVPIS
ncbi:hypothetical protein ACFS07_28520 [Undibacterium arcticum]